jgi:hypothetical protein
VLVAGAYPNVSVCRLSSCPSGDMTDWPDLTHCTTTDLEQAPATRSRLGCADRAALSPDSHVPWCGTAAPLPPRSMNGKPETSELAKHLAPSLLAICGCGPLTAAKILGAAAGVD